VITSLQTFRTESKAFVWHEGKPETSQVIKVAGNTKMDFSVK